MADFTPYRAPDEWFVVRYLAGRWWQRYAVVRFVDGRFVFADEENERAYFLRADKAEAQADWLNFVDGVLTADATAEVVQRGVAEFKAQLAALDRSHRGCG